MNVQEIKNKLSVLQEEKANLVVLRNAENALPSNQTRQGNKNVKTGQNGKKHRQLQIKCKHKDNEIQSQLKILEKAEQQGIFASQNEDLHDQIALLKKQALLQNNSTVVAVLDSLFRVGRIYGQAQYDKDFELLESNSNEVEHIERAMHLALNQARARKEKIEEWTEDEVEKHEEVEKYPPRGLKRKGRFDSDDNGDGDDDEEDNDNSNNNNNNNNNSNKLIIINNNNNDNNDEDEDDDEDGEDNINDRKSKSSRNNNNSSRNSSSSSSSGNGNSNSLNSNGGRPKTRSNFHATSSSSKAIEATIALAPIQALTHPQNICSNCKIGLNNDLSSSSSANLSKYNNCTTCTMIWCTKKDCKSLCNKHLQGCPSLKKNNK